MANTGSGEEQKDWARLQVYVPPDFYAVLQARAKHRGVSLSAEGLRLMRLGLANVKPSESIAADLTALQRYLELHLEPLAFISATDSAYGREAWRLQLYGSRPHDAAEVDRKLGERATKRLQRKLRGFGAEDAEGGDDDGEDGD